MMMHKTPTADNKWPQSLATHLSQKTSVGVGPTSLSQPRYTNTSPQQQRQQLFVCIIILYN